MKVLITGGSGLVGKRVVEELFKEGHEVYLVTRNIERTKQKLYLPVHFVQGDLSKKPLSLDNQDFDAVINLAGENIGEKRWSTSQKAKILKSRKSLALNLKKSLRKIGVLVQASAVGVYKKELGDHWLDVASTSDNDFLAEVVREWENAAGEIKADRKVILRIGAVISHEGGLIKKLLPIYRFGVGGKLGSGRQWMSWIHREDLVTAIIRALTGSHSGVFNAVSPHPIQNKEMNSLFSKYTQRPALFHAPRLAIKTILGEQSIIALGSQRVKSNLADLGVHFQYPDFDAALKKELGFMAAPPLVKENFHYIYRQVQYIDLPIEKVFDFFTEAKNLERITPDSLNFKITYQSTDKIQQGTVFRYRLKVHGLPVFWETHITDWKELESFSDYQNKGPYQVWYHTHLFEKCNNGTLMTDIVRYRLPMGLFGDLGGLWLVKKDIEKIFSHRALGFDQFLGELR